MCWYPVVEDPTGIEPPLTFVPYPEVLKAKVVAVAWAEDVWADVGGVARLRPQATNNPVTARGADSFKRGSCQSI
jgi:hypothetical protein